MLRRLPSMGEADRDATRRALSKPAAFVVLCKGLALKTNTSIQKSAFGAAEFRAELLKIMPGYAWTVHKQPKYRDVDKANWPLSATGIQSSGSNRLSTLEVCRRVNGGQATYTAKSAGYGTRARWLHENADRTLASALRGLQDHYKAMADTYRSHERALSGARATAVTGAAT